MADASGGYVDPPPGSYVRVEDGQREYLIPHAAIRALLDSFPEMSPRPHRPGGTAEDPGH